MFRVKFMNTLGEIALTWMIKFMNTLGEIALTWMINFMNTLGEIALTWMIKFMNTLGEIALTWMIKFMNTFGEISLTLMPQLAFGDQSTLVQVMAWCRLSTSNTRTTVDHYLRRHVMWRQEATICWYGHTGPTPTHIFVWLDLYCPLMAAMAMIRTSCRYLHYKDKTVVTLG